MFPGPLDFISSSKSATSDSRIFFNFNAKNRENAENTSNSKGKQRECYVDRSVATLWIIPILRRNIPPSEIMIMNHVLLSSRRIFEVDKRNSSSLVHNPIFNPAIEKKYYITGARRRIIFEWCNSWNWCGLLKWISARKMGTYIVWWYLKPLVIVVPICGFVFSSHNMTIW